MKMLTAAPALAEAALKVVSEPRARARTRTKIFGLGKFLQQGCPAIFHGAFRDNIRRFQRECADVEERAMVGMPTWRTLLVEEGGNVVFRLYVVEEDVRSSSHPICDYCRCAGWSHHLVSRRRYHVIIPRPGASETHLRPDDFAASRHLLHGVFHCNGFGHLLLLNAYGIGGGCTLPGCRLMDLWDRFCSALRAREVSLRDLSAKKSMELRLLYGIAYGAPWFARWGYRFAKASYAVSEFAYDYALDGLSSLPLDSLVDALEETGDAASLRRVVATYREISCRQREVDLPPLLTVRDLLRFLLDFKRRAPSLPLFDPASFPAFLQFSQADIGERRDTDKKRKRSREFDRFAEQLESRWSVQRLRKSAEVIVNALRRSSRKMSRQEVRDAARLVVGDTGLIDFVLKSIDDCEVDGCVVRRMCNYNTRRLEFSLEHLPQQRPEDEEAVITRIGMLNPLASLAWPSVVKLDKDVLVVYESLLKGLPEEVKIVLRAKHWVKKWGLQDDLGDHLRFLVRWMPTVEEMNEFSRELPPPEEVVVVEETTTVGELIKEAERAMQDTYCVMEGFRVERMDGVEGRKWDHPSLTSSVVWVYGAGVDMGCALRYEGGADGQVVACACGAQDYDGERMAACEVCYVWHHTRCADISDEDPVPPFFLCNLCRPSLLCEDTGMISSF